MCIDKFPKITVILRGLSREFVDIVVQAMNETAIRSVEIAANSPDAFGTIAYLRGKYPGIHVGAGTILNREQLKQAIDSGAEFVLSPTGYTEEIFALCKKYAVITVPGAMTPMEIKQQVDLGADIVKVFPAAVVGAGFFKDVKAPLGNIPLMAVGGVNIKNAKEFLDNKADYLGIGSGMFAQEDIAGKNASNLIGSLQQFEKITG
jgi:2-dehydro-3-deoxyphosphogluconate aldolase/(4S)-4-hydroxy-2-oxoglutarate aldolase